MERPCVYATLNGGSFQQSANCDAHHRLRDVSKVHITIDSLIRPNAVIDAAIARITTATLNHFYQRCTSEKKEPVDQHTNTIGYSGSSDGTKSEQAGNGSKLTDCSSNYIQTVQLLR